MPGQGNRAGGLGQQGALGVGGTGGGGGGRGVGVVGVGWGAVPVEGGGVFLLGPGPSLIIPSIPSVAIEPINVCPGAELIPKACSEPWPSGSA